MRASRRKLHAATIAIAVATVIINLFISVYRTETLILLSQVCLLVLLALFSGSVTLTTLGFGDIAPRSAVARNLVVLEAIMGQLYLAILVARLVGLPIVHEKKPGAPDDSR